MIILRDREKTPIKAVVFDFDGTLSTLRSGWESVMAPLMCRTIAGDCRDAATLAGISDAVARYIDASTGIQTIHQMKWLVATAMQYGLNPNVCDDPWHYKNEYNELLMKTVSARLQDLRSGRAAAADYLIEGSVEFLSALSKRSIRLYAASGTDECDVKNEARALGLAEYFDKISGSLPRSEDCSKAAVISRLLSEGEGIMTVGDGKVEIMLGRQNGALTLGVASDEVNRRGVNPVKLKRLDDAGAHAVVGDFSELDELLDWMGV